MKCLLLFTIVFVAVPALPADPVDDCSDDRALAALYQIRSLMMKSDSTYEGGRFIDRKLDELRQPTADGGFRWVRWAVPAGDPPFQKDLHLTAAAQDRGDSDH